MVKRKGRSEQFALPKPLRVWPGVIIVGLQWLIRFVVPNVVPGTVEMGVIGALVGGLAVILWWAFFSRAPRIERWGAVVLIIVGLIVTSRTVHASIGTGMQGLMPFVYAVPVLCLAFVVWALATRRLTDKIRRATMIAVVLLACGVWTLFRSRGITGEADADFTWRWAVTHEEQLLTQTGDEPMLLPPVPAAADSGADWPGFRGPNRDGIIRGVRIETDWSTSPPVELWRRPVGPGCSSFAVRGTLIYTQEQRGDDEIVACYDLTTGEPVWRHHDTARFWDSHAGAGPRSTPTLINGRVYTLGATGILNVLDAENGKRNWKGGRYGGQLLLLADQDLLLILSEKGELALVQALSNRYTEIARFQAIHGKTWNHPVLVGDILLIRNSEEMAAFRLSLQDEEQDLPSQPPA
ncbi:PQQ-binding-like beta-propeller repeat protein [candidate division KSB1 bacterium]|nr:PQQ-binding-like beta-propeller repeat protein [candidate division KSB1 bacterium]